jgi:membrane fusion protein
MSDLFRKEAVLHATRRLSGPVVLATPLSVRVRGLFFIAVLFCGVAFASVATYARKATVTGWLVPDQGLIRAANSAGFVQSLKVNEGDVVTRGAKLAEIRIGTDIVAGNVGENLVQQLITEADATRARARTRIERLDAESGQTATRLVNLRNELEQVKIQTQLQEQRLELARQELVRGEEIATKGFMSRRELDQRRSAALLAEQELASQRRQITAAERDIADMTARVGAIEIEKKRHAPRVGPSPTRRLADCRSWPHQCPVASPWCRWL